MSSENNGREAPTPATRPLTTRPLTAASDPGRRLRELLQEAEPAAPATPESVAAPASPEPPPPPPAPPPPVEMVRLFVMLDGTRLAPVEYPGREALPTRTALEQTHRAYILRDHWTQADDMPVWTVYMKRKKR